MRTARSIPALAVAGLLLVTACGDDDDDAGGSDATEAAATATTEAAPAATQGGTAGDGTAHDTAYCEAHLGLEGAVSSEDPAAAGPAIAAAQAAAPPEIADALETAIANAPTDGPPSPEFHAAYGEVVGWIRDHCGFAEITIEATDYAFAGLGESLPAGPTIVNLANGGAEFHEAILMRKQDGVTESFEELLALPEDQVGEKVAILGAAFAAPGETGSLVTDLAAGEYLAICFVPMGATAEAMASGSIPEDAPPHFHAGHAAGVHRRVSGRSEGRRARTGARGPHRAGAGRA